MRFTKMHGLGNDFVVIDGIRQDVTVDAELARRLAHRRYGVGCDQVLVAEPATLADMDVRYRVFNSDGGEVEHCGNGVRCLAVFLREQGLVSSPLLRVETRGEPATVCLQEDGLVSVDMGPPQLDPSGIPFSAPARELVYPLTVDGRELRIAAVSMGNPHAVLQVPDADQAPVGSLGPLIEGHPAFPQRANAGFMQVLDRGHIRLRVYERGAGETLACGTGACAAAVAGRLQGLLDEDVNVDLPGGRLRIRWQGEGKPVWMTGPATTVFHGDWPGP